MQQIYSSIIDSVPFRFEPALSFNFLQAIIRSILQYAAFSAVDICTERRGIYAGTLLGEIGARLLEPADGNLPWAIGSSIEILREDEWPGCALAWSRWECPIELDDAVPKHSVAALAQYFVEFRNNRPGHGVVDETTVTSATRWLPGVARALLVGLQDLLPRLDSRTGRLAVRTPGADLPIHSCRLVDGKPVVVRRIARRGSSWRALYQTLDARRSLEGGFELEDSAPIVKLTCARPGLYAQKTIPTGGGTAWKPTVLLPQRQTTIFEGREQELSLLRHWWDDPDSRACLVYGDGGIGKTTLVLESVHSALEMPWSGCWKPDLVCFFSAKETRWGPNGLEEIKGIAPSLAEAARQLARSIEDRPDASWFRLDTKSLLAKVVGLFSDVGLKRDRVLVILDNTETLARSSTQEEDLARGVAFMASRIGRVILTSRRREPLEALPLKVPPMNEQVGMALLRRLAAAYDAVPLRAAGDSTLRRAANQLGGRPLLLDILARLIGRTGCAIDRGIEAVLAQAAEDLGHFLFEDAWNRIDPNCRDVFFVVAQLGATVDGEAVGWACAELGVGHADWLDAFEETRFGAILEYGTRYDLILDHGMREFVIRKFSTLASNGKQRIEKIANRVRKKHVAYLQAQDSDITDRVAQAFRTAAAKAAKLAVARGDYEEAIMWYEEAIKADPVNSALLDRFAWFLLMFVHDLERAARCSDQACKVGPNDADAHFTAGMVAARQRDLDAADRLFDRAIVLGKPRHLCVVQKAKARIAIMDRLDRQHEKVRSGEAERLLREADALLREAVLARAETNADRRHMDERKNASIRLALLSQRLRISSEPEVQKI